tara:strand:- start:668 stop:1018 length:351 start_codon:yes stop_codon:yes gene_type:complete
MANFRENYERYREQLLITNKMKLQINRVLSEFVDNCEMVIKTAKSHDVSSDKLLDYLSRVIHQSDDDLAKKLIKTITIDDKIEFIEIYSDKNFAEIKKHFEMRIIEMKGNILRISQ